VGAYVPLFSSRRRCVDRYTSFYRTANCVQFAVTLLTVRLSVRLSVTVVDFVKINKHIVKKLFYRSTYPPFSVVIIIINFYYHLQILQCAYYRMNIGAFQAFVKKYAYKKLSYCRGSALCAVSVEIMSIAAQLHGKLTSKALQ